MLVFNLKKEWYEKIEKGEKTIEYRFVNDYWSRRVNNAIRQYESNSDDLNIPCRVVRGYSKTYINGFVNKILIDDKNNTDLKDVNSIYDKVYCFYFVLDRGNS